MASIWDTISPFGQKPVIPKLPKEKTAQALGTALTATTGAFPQIAKLGDLYTSYLRGQIPGFAANLGAEAATAGSLFAQAAPEIRGQIPQDVQDQIMRIGAMQNLLSGGGGDFLRSLQARDLGLTSLQLQGQGAQLAGAGGNLAQQTANLALGTAFNPSSYFISPAQQIAVDQWNIQNQFQRNLLAAQVAAAPNPTAKGISDIVETLTAAYLGGLGGGKGGTPSPGGGPGGPSAPDWAANAASSSGGFNVGGGGGFGGPIQDPFASDPYNNIGMGTLFGGAGYGGTDAFTASLLGTGGPNQDIGIQLGNPAPGTLSLSPYTSSYDFSGTLTGG